MLSNFENASCLQVLQSLAAAHLEGDGNPEAALNFIRQLTEECGISTPALSYLSLKALWKLGSLKVGNELCTVTCNCLVADAA